jgi:hypothetical protein
MTMKNLALLFFILMLGSAKSQSLDAREIKLSILNDTLSTTSGDPRINLSFSVRNCSNLNLIIYELNSKIIRDAFGSMDPYCDQETTSAAVILYVFDAAAKPITAIHWYVNDLRNPMTSMKLDSLMSVHKDSYLSRAVVLKKLQRENFQQEIDLREFKLARGQYFIQLLYFAGKRIRNFVTEDDMLKDTVHFDGTVFQGCLVSNKCVLMVQ